MEAERRWLADREERCPHCGSGQTWANGECRSGTPRPPATADDCPDCAGWREQLVRDPDLANYYDRNPYLWHHWDVVCPDCGTLWHATAGLSSDTRCPTCRSS